MTKIHKQAILPFSQEQMFDLVNDVDGYPQFVPYCSSVELLASSEEQIEARVGLKKGLLSQSFVTKNALERPHKMIMHLQEGPFKQFSGEWFFHALDEKACKVELIVEFELTSKLGGLMLPSVFEKAAGQIVDAFCQRAKEVYG